MNAVLETHLKPGWRRVCPLEEIPRLGSRVVKSRHGDIAVFRAADDQVFALRDKCPHRGGPLSQGIVFEHKVACPLHGLVMNLESGEAAAPDTGCTGRFPVKVEDAIVYVEV